MFEQLWDSELLIIYPLVQSINISINNIFKKNTAVKIIKVNFLGFVIDTPCMNWFIITQKIKYAFIFLSPCCFLLCNYGITQLFIQTGTVLREKEILRIIIQRQQACIWTVPGKPNVWFFFTMCISFSQCLRDYHHLKLGQCFEMENAFLFLIGLISIL